VAEARLFIGLWPPDEVRDAVLRHAGRWTWPRGARPVRPDKIHLTMHFLGSVPRDRVATLERAIAVPFDPFELRLTHGKLWPGGIAVLAPEVVPPELRVLHERLGQALEGLGQTSARSQLRAHVTLARHAQRAVPPAQPDDIRWPVRGFALIESDRRPPTQYRTIAAYA
jgi:2'-5' RNA ligase